MVMVAKRREPRCDLCHDEAMPLRGRMICEWQDFAATAALIAGRDEIHPERVSLLVCDACVTELHLSGERVLERLASGLKRGGN